jgi:DNA-binding NarL/FixJ family response regulator
VVRQVREAVANTKVLVRTMHESGEMVSRALDAGGQGYLLKPDRDFARFPGLRFANPLE